MMIIYQMEINIRLIARAVSTQMLHYCSLGRERWGAPRSSVEDGDLLHFCTWGSRSCIMTSTSLHAALDKLEGPSLRVDTAPHQ